MTTQQRSSCHILKAAGASRQGGYSVEPVPSKQLEVWNKKMPQKRIKHRVEWNTSLPGNWQQFLILDANKQELFTFLARHTKRTQNLADGKQLVNKWRRSLQPTWWQHQRSPKPLYTGWSGHKNALHTVYAVKQGCKKIVLRTVDTDVVVLSVVAVPRPHL